MAAYVALLRAVNVAGHNKVAMVDLRRMLADLGLAGPRSYIQSGNLLFDDERSALDLETMLERESAARLGLATAYFVRSRDAWTAMIAANPFPEQVTDDPGRLVAVLLKGAPSAEAMAGLRERIVGRETVEAVGPTLYARYPDGIGVSKLTARLIETALGTQGTARNWKTVLRLQAMLQE